MRKFKGIVYPAVILSMVFWAFSFVWVKEVYVAYGPLTTVFIRLILASAIMFTYGKITRKLEPISGSDFKTFLLLAFFEPFLYFMGESFGLKYVSSTMGAIIIATIPLFSPLAASRFYGEKLSVRNLVGILLSFLGVGLVVFDGSFNFVASPLGIALEFLAVFSAVGYTVVLKDLADKYSSTTIITWQNFIGIFYFFPFWAVFESHDFMNTPFHLPAFVAILKLAVFASCIAFILYTYSVRELGINNSNIFINIIPVLTALFAWYILDEPLTLKKIAGMTIVICGLFIAQIKMKAMIAKLISIQQDGGR